MPRAYWYAVRLIGPPATAGDAHARPRLPSRVRSRSRSSCLGAFVGTLALASALLIPASSHALPILNPDNGHYYELISTLSLAISWTDARDAAAASTYDGLTGYLATSTSLSEETFVESLFPTQFGNYWLGGGEAEDGVWLWLTGPEAGTQFWQGGTAGSAVNGAYEDWQRFAADGSLKQPEPGGVIGQLAIEVNDDGRLASL